jgi:hypothetical protein
MAVWAWRRGSLGQALAVASEQAIRADGYRERAAGDPEPPAAARDEPPASCAANNPPVAYRRALNSHATPKTGTDQANVAEPCIAFLDPVSVGAINPVNVGRSARRPGIPVVRTEAPFPHPSVEKARLACRALRHRTRGLRSIRVRPTTSAEQAHKHSDLCPPRHIPIVGRVIPRPHPQKDGFASRTRDKLSLAVRFTADNGRRTGMTFTVRLEQADGTIGRPADDGEHRHELVRRRDDPDRAGSVAARGRTGTRTTPRPYVSPSLARVARRPRYLANRDWPKRPKPGASKANALNAIPSPPRAIVHNQRSKKPDSLASCGSSES